MVMRRYNSTIIGSTGVPAASRMFFTGADSSSDFLLTNGISLGCDGAAIIV